MAEDSGNTNGRVTNSQLYKVLDERTELIRAEQKSEHLKTRILVVALSLPASLKALPTLLGFYGLNVGWNVPWWPF